MFWGGAFLLTNLLFDYSFLKDFCARAHFFPLGRGRENLFQLRMALDQDRTLQHPDEKAHKSLGYREELEFKKK